MDMIGKFRIATTTHNIQTRLIWATAIYLLRARSFSPTLHIHETLIYISDLKDYLYVFNLLCTTYGNLFWRREAKDTIRETWGPSSICVHYLSNCRLLITLSRENLCGTTSWKHVNKGNIFTFMGTVYMLSDI